jgi:nucleotide-binding universal stress UspA family protein
MERIVTAVDGSAPSLKAVDFAADLAGKYDAEVILIAVADHRVPVADPAMEEFARAEHMQAPTTELGLAAAETVLAGACIEARAKGASRVSTMPALGDPAEEIIRCAEERHADLLVLGTRGHTRLGGLLHGRVAQLVIGRAPCPVAVVR